MASPLSRGFSSWADLHRALESLEGLDLDPGEAERLRREGTRDEFAALSGSSREVAAQGTTPRTFPTVGIPAADVSEAAGEFVTTSRRAGMDGTDAARRAEIIARSPRTAGGDRPVLTRFVDEADRSVLGSFRPQLIETPSELGQRRSAERERQQIAEVRRQLEREQRDEKRAAGVAVFEPPAAMQQRIDVNPLAEGLRAVLTDEAADVGTVESPVAWAIRVLSAPLSALSAVGHDAPKGEALPEAVAERIRKGEGLAGGMRDAVDHLAEATGVAADGSTPWYRDPATLGFVGGLAAELAIPIDLGVGSVASRTAGAVREAGRAARAVNQPAAETFLAHLRKRAAGINSDVHSEAIRRFAQDDAARSIADRFLGVQEIRTVGESFAEASARSPDAQVREAITRAGGPDEYAAELRVLGMPVDATVGEFRQAWMRPAMHRIALDAALPDEVKAQITRSAAVASDEVRTSLAGWYATRSAEEQALIRADFPEFELQGSPDVLRLPSGEARSALVGSFLEGVGAARLRAAVAAGTAQGPDLVQLSPGSYVPRQRAQEVVEAVRRSPVGALGSRIVEAGGAVELTDDARRALAQWFIGRFEGELAVESVSAARRQLGPVVVDVLTQRTPVGPETYNRLVQRAIDIEAQAVPSSSTAAEVDAMFGAASAPRRVELAEMLKPEEIAGGRLETWIKSRSASIFEEGSVGSPIAEQLGSQIRGRFAGALERFKSDIRRARGRGRTPQQAFADVLFDGYRRAGPDVERELNTVRVRGAGEVLDVERAEYGQLFDDFVAGVYGGFDRVSDALQTSDRDLVQDAMRIAPGEMKRLVTAAARGNNFVGQARELFVDLAERGERTEAITVLAGVHQAVAGRPLHAWASLEQIERLGRRARWETGAFLDTRGSQRGLRDVWTFGRDTPPLYDPSDFTELLGATYLTRQQGDIVREVVEEVGARHPQLFPNGKALVAAGEAESLRTLADIRQRFDRLRQQRAVTTIDEEALISRELFGERSPLYRALTDAGPDLVRRSVVDATEHRMTGGKPRQVEALFFDEAGAPLPWLVEASRSVVNARAPRRARVLTRDFIRAVEEGLRRHPNAELSSPASRWLDEIAPVVRSDMTALFWAQMRTAYQEAYRSVRSGVAAGRPSRASAAEEITRIPLATEDGAALRTQLQGAANVKGLTEALDEMRLPPGQGQRPDLALGPLELVDLGEADQLDAFLRAVDKVKLDHNPYAQRLVRAVRDVLETGSPTVPVSGRRLTQGALRVWDGLGNVAKTGVLGGLLLPNPIYMMTNFLTAPAIINATLGGRRAVGAIQLDALRVVREIYGLGGESGKALFRTPAGAIYTTSDLADMVSGSSIMRSQAAAELRRSALGEIVRWSGLNQRGADVGRVRDFIRRNMNPVGSMNLWTEIANGTDIVFRTGVLVDALKAGRTEAEALTLAREALFDYGRLSQVERDVIARFMWFWSFHRENLRSVVRSLLNNPSRAMHLAKMSRGLPQDGEYTHSSREWNNARPFLKLISDGPARERYAVYGPSIPFVDGMAALADYLAIVAPVVDEGVSAREVPGDVAERAVGAVTKQARPLTKLGIALATGRELRFDRAEAHGTYLDPRYLWALQESPLMWELFTSVVNVEPVPYDERQAGETTFDGIVWRIPKTDDASRRNWFLLRQAALGLGLQRHWRDTAPWFAGQREGEITGPELEVAAPWEALRNLGVVRVSPESAPEDATIRQRGAALQELRRRSP